MFNLYYWSQRKNFGDQLAPYLVEHFAQTSVQWATPEDADLVAAGSVLQHLPTTWTGTVCGAGKLHTGSLALPLARFLAVRGRLTAAGLGLSPGGVRLGDPVLLIDELVARPAACWDLGIVPHWTDDILIKRFTHLASKYDVAIISPRDDPLVVVQQIAACRKIVSSSLHGVIVADAYGIPRRAERFPRMYSQWEGGEYKWHDYASAIGTPMIFGEVQTPRRAVIEAVQQQLFEAFHELEVGVAA